MLRRSTTTRREGSEFVVPEEPDRLITWLDERRERAMKRIPLRKQKMNLAFLLGQQWLTWDDSKSMWTRPRASRDDPNAPIRITVNKIGGITERFIARLTKASPEPDVRAVTSDEADINAAKAGRRILLSEFNRVNWESWLIEHYFFVVCMGHAYAQIAYNPDGGNELGSVDDDVVMSGDVTLETVPSYELGVDPNARSMRDAKWAVRTQMMTREAVWEYWGVDVPASGDKMRTISDEVYALMDSEYDMDHEDLVAVHQFWMVPCRAAPEGIVVTWAGKKMLEEPMPFPYEHGRLPFVQFDLLPGMGRREGRTWMDDLLAMQADYNDARSREAGIRRTVTPKLISASGSIPKGSVTSRVEHIEYNPGLGIEPKWEVPDSGWMNQHETTMNRSDMEMGDRAGQSDVSSGKPASASMPAAAILALQEADDTKLAITYKEMTDAIKEVAWQWLELVRQFWTTERQVNTWSEEGAIEVAHFSGADITHQLDVHLATDTGVARSKSAQTQLAMELFQMQVITDPRQLLRLIKVPGADFIAEAWNVDTRQAQRENERLLLGEVVEVNTFDNHQVHIAEHDNQRKSEEYDKLSRAAAAGDKEAIKKKAAIDSHADIHYQMYAPMVQGQPAPNLPEGAVAEQVAARTGGGGGSQYLDPRTGLPPNPTMVAAGQAPSALAGSQVAKRAGIGGAGQPGRVPGVDSDSQAASMGA